jgi:eukaryotic-like serine/threonine-protein kinase
VSRPRAGGGLEAVGRAQRFACLDSPHELWVFEAADAAVARRLAAFGEAGAGGFVGHGEDDAGPFALRRVPSQTLERLPKGERLDGPTALAKVRDLALALARFEEKAIFPGPLRPSEIALGSDGRVEAFVLAEGWVRALAGGAHPGSGSSAPSARWTPPEQAGGAPWDNAANRYVLGLAAYRLLTGAHPFSGIGLRDAMAAQSVAPPPFEEAIARSLKPGIQSFVLQMLDPDEARRPGSAREIAARCEELLHGAALPARRSTAPAPVAAPPQKAPPREASRPKRHLRNLAPIAVGLAIAGASFAASKKPTPPPEPPKRVLTQRPLEKTTSETCAPCHARHVAEWQRSVMAHSVKSPLFGALESAIEEQVGRDDRCPGGAGILRKGGVCRDERTGISVTGSGGEHWCVNCHAAGDNLASTVPAWTPSGSPLRDVLAPRAMEGISCAVCHETIGPVHATAAYQGNPTWISPITGSVFRMRPEDGVGQRGISNSGYLLDPSIFLTPTLGRGADHPIVHRRPSEDTSRYLRSSEFCGACHDVRLFGTDAIGKERGEHFKRLRNAYSEWRTWSESERAAGRRSATCQDCHMSLYPGVCVQDASKGKREGGCPPGFRFEARAPGEKARGLVAAASRELRPITSHTFTSIDLPLSKEFPDAWADDPAIDASGVPLGVEARREQLLRHTFRFAVGAATRIGTHLEIPIEIENTGAGHRVPAGFSQERETWVELVVRDARGSVAYEVGTLASDDADLKDKIFLRTNVGEDVRDRAGKPQGVFGADVIDGPDVPRWSPNPTFGGTTFRGRGLLNLQNGFLRCVRCIGVIDGAGRCQAGPGQGRTRADRFADGIYDIDTGECRSNLVGTNAFFETYFPIGGLDADRGAVKAPDAILDQRSAPPGAVLRYTYELDLPGHAPPFSIQARLRFRPFPPFLLRAFADYEARKAAQGLRPSGPQVTSAMFRRNHPVDIAQTNSTIP